MPSKKNVGRAFRIVRHAAGLSQEDFVFASNRTYVSAIERGLKSPTIEKLSQLAQVMNSDAALIIALATLIEMSQTQQDMYLEHLTEAAGSLIKALRSD